MLAVRQSLWIFSGRFFFFHILHQCIMVPFIWNFDDLNGFQPLMPSNNWHYVTFFRIYSFYVCLFLPLYRKTINFSYHFHCEIFVPLKMLWIRYCNHVIKQSLMSISKAIWKLFSILWFRKSHILLVCFYPNIGF